MTFAESCTGGLLSAVFCSVPGASEVYDGGLVSYANSVKHRLLSVEESVLSTFGPVSEQCCAQMAKGACALFSAQLGLAVTGFAGPGGGTPAAPVGTFFVAAVRGGAVCCRRFFVKGSRRRVTKHGVKEAFRIIEYMLKQNSDA